MEQLELEATARTRARRADPNTSKAAAKRAEKWASTHAGIIHAALLDYWPMTFSEIARVSGLSESQVWRRLPEMQRAGYVDIVRDDSGAEVTRLGSSGDHQRVWRAIEL